MPKGVPTAEQLMSGSVKGFSIDTCIFESLGFNLETGELGVLRQQLPPWLALFIPSIVKREILAHQIANVRKSEQELQSAIRNIHRHSGIDVSSLTPVIEKLHLADVSKLFDSRLEKFVSKFGGKVITESGDTLLQETFERYFSSQSPFESKKEKKFEFPDAVALLALRELVETEFGFGYLILVSNDEGWIRFCEQSDSLFCVRSLEELAGLYQADAQATAKIGSQVTAALKDFQSRLTHEIESELEELIPDCSWIVDACTGYCERVDADLDWAEFRKFYLDSTPLRLWLSNNEHEICVIEFDLVVTCRFKVSAEFSCWDSIDREYCSIGMGSKRFESDVPMTAYLTLTGELSTRDIDSCEIRFELSQQDYSIDAGEMEPDYEEYEEEQSGTPISRPESSE